MARTISKNGKRVKASEKGKAKRPKPVEAEDQHVPPAPQVRENVVRAGSAPLLRLTVPTDIGKLCSDESSKYALGVVAILTDYTSDDRVFLTATNGRAMAIVRADWERVGDTEAAGLHAAWVPREFAKTLKGDGRTLRLAKGDPETLFGDGIKWVDDAEGRFLDVPDGGQFPPFNDLLPTLDDEYLCVRVRASQITQLAAALNDSRADDRDSITLFIRGKPGVAADNAYLAVGSNGIGLGMPVAASREASIGHYNVIRHAVGVGRPKRKVIANAAEAMNPEPPDAAQQTPSGESVDKHGGKPEPIDADSGHTNIGDGKDGPSVPDGTIKIAHMTLTPETKAALRDAGFVTIKHVAQCYEEGGDPGLLIESEADRARLLDCAKPFLPEPAAA